MKQSNFLNHWLFSKIKILRTKCTIIIVIKNELKLIIILKFYALKNHQNYTVIINNININLITARYSTLLDWLKNHVRSIQFAPTSH